MSLAQTFATLDHIARGRVILGIGNGIRENTEPYGFPVTKRVARLEEALQIIRGLWGSNGEPFNHKGRFWTLRDAVFDLPLYAGKPPRIFLGAHFPLMLRLCGRFGDGWLPGQKISGEGYAERLGVIREAARESNRSFEGFLPCQTLLVAFGTNREAVLEKALKNEYIAYLTIGQPGVVWEECGLEHPLGNAFPGFVDIVPSRIDQSLVHAALEQMTPELIERYLYMGTPGEILAQAAPLAAAGCRHFIIANMGAAFTGAGLSDFVRMATLARALKRL
jgi:phthiodiolone/phenolphthiodiolone dimycocerosates ketoreductase